MDATKNEDQTLRAVDPGASVEAGAMPPQPGDLGVAPLVRAGRFPGIAPLLHPTPHFSPQLDADKFLFGVVPAVGLQHWFWTGSVHWSAPLILDVTKLPFIVPPILAFLLWMKRRALFY